MPFGSIENQFIVFIINIFLLSSLALLVRSLFVWSSIPISYLLLVVSTVAASLAALINFPSFLTAVPDAVEYAYMAKAFFEDGELMLQMLGREFPSRYYPWFSVFLLSPFLLIPGTELSVLLVPVFLYAVLLVVTASMLAFKLGSYWGATLVAVLLVMIPEFQVYAQQVMTDVPSAAILVVAAASFVQMSGSQQLSSRSVLCIGVIVAVAASWRMLSVFILFPFVFMVLSRKRERLKNLLCLGLPSALLLVSNLVYQIRVFERVFRNGYHFWTPIPYDFPGLVFNSKYLAVNFLDYFAEGSIYLFLGIILGSQGLYRFSWGRQMTEASRMNSLSRLIVFVLLWGFPYVTFHLFYFYTDDRFILPLLCLLAVLAGVSLTLFSPRSAKVRIVSNALLAILLFLFTTELWLKKSIPTTKQLAVAEMKTLAIKGESLISGIDPLYLELFGISSSIPVSRRVEYANKLIAPEKVEAILPESVSALDHRSPVLAEAGAIDAISEVAIENLSVIRERIEQGEQIYLDNSALLPGELEQFDRAFKLVQVGHFIFRLELS